MVYSTKTPYSDQLGPFVCVEPEALEGRSLQSANRRPAARLASRASSIPSLLAEGLGFGGVSGSGRSLLRLLGFVALRVLGCWRHDKAFGSWCLVHVWSRVASEISESGNPACVCLGLALWGSYKVRGVEGTATAAPAPAGNPCGA